MTSEPFAVAVAVAAASARCPSSWESLVRVAAVGVVARFVSGWVVGFTAAPRSQRLVAVGVVGGTRPHPERSWLP